MFKKMYNSDCTFFLSIGRYKLSNFSIGKYINLVSKIVTNLMKHLYKNHKVFYFLGNIYRLLYN